LFVRGVTDYAIYMLDPNGTIIEWNAGAERIKGYKAEEIIGQHVSRLYTEEDRNAGVPQRALERAAKEGRHESEGWRVRKDGTRFFASVVVDAVHDSAGRLAGFAKITRDIGEKVEQQQALVQYQKMDALGQLTGGIAHDFNNLLHVIKNAADVLARRLQGVDPEIREYLAMLKRNADRAASLTQRLLAFSRRQILDPAPINPRALVLDVTSLLEQALGESINIETVLNAGLWWVSVDKTQLETAILNLAINARDAMAGKGKLTIEVSNAYLDERYAAAHAEVKPGQYVMIAVSDTGRGMTRDVVSRAFEPFFTTKEPGRGTGLGLSQVYGFIKQSGGHAKLYSEPGEGTTVKLYLPRLFPVPSHAQPEAAPAAFVPGAERGTILLVEDDDDVRNFTADALGELGYRVLTARDAAAALRILEAQPGVNLLFTDIGLPGGVNGRELANQALMQHRTLKVLFTTGYTRNAVIHHGRLDPDVDLIAKPYTQTSLREAIKRVLEGEAS
jgi:PAS domain S-box-containing protein